MKATGNRVCFAYEIDFSDCTEGAKIVIEGVITNVVCDEDGEMIVYVVDDAGKTHVAYFDEVEPVTEGDNMR